MSVHLPSAPSIVTPQPDGATSLQEVMEKLNVLIVAVGTLNVQFNSLNNKHDELRRDVDRNAEEFRREMAGLRRDVDRNADESRREMAELRGGVGELRNEVRRNAEESSRNAAEFRRNAAEFRRNADEFRRNAEESRRNADESRRVMAELRRDVDELRVGEPPAAFGVYSPYPKVSYEADQSLKKDN